MKKKATTNWHSPPAFLHCLSLSSAGPHLHRIDALGQPVAHCSNRTLEPVRFDDTQSRSLNNAADLAEIATHSSTTGK
jgi:hypothetical protein